jgi:hypothetical protein
MAITCRNMLGWISDTLINPTSSLTHLLVILQRYYKMLGPTIKIKTPSFCPTLQVLDSSFLLCLSWLLRSRVRKAQRDLWITLYICTALTNCHDVSKSNEGSNFRTIRKLLDRADTLHSVLLSKEEAKNIVGWTTSDKVENCALFFLNTSLSPLI